MAKVCLILILSTLVTLMTPSASFAALSYYGYYGVFDPSINQDYINEVAGSANNLVIAYRPDYPSTYNRALADRLRASNIKLSYYIDVGNGDFCGTDAQASANRRARLMGIRNQLQASTLLPLISSIQPSEEWWSRMWLGQLDNWNCLNIANYNYYDKIRIFKAKIEAVIADYNAVFPGIPIMITEGGYNASSAPVFSNVDIIGLDVYIQGGLGCDAGSKAWFDQNVAAVFDHNATFGKRVMMIGHGFSSNGYPMPQTCTLQWFIDLARSRTYMTGLLWFIWGDAYDPRGTGGISGLRSNPVQRDYLWQQGRLATDGLAVIQRRVGNAWEVVAPYFDEGYYQQIYPDVAYAVRMGWFQSGFQHFMLYGGIERRRPNNWFDENSYRTYNLDVNGAVGVWLTSGFEHYLRWGASEGRIVIPEYNERVYLTRYPDIRDAVRDAGWFWFSGLRHYILAGRSEGRSAR